LDFGFLEFGILEFGIWNFGFLDFGFWILNLIRLISFFIRKPTVTQRKNSGSSWHQQRDWSTIDRVRRKIGERKTRIYKTSNKTLLLRGHANPGKITNESYKKVRLNDSGRTGKVTDRPISSKYVASSSGNGEEEFVIGGDIHLIEEEEEKSEMYRLDDVIEKEGHEEEAKKDQKNTFLAVRRLFSKSQV
jgi:hypothetical protein